MQEKSDRAPPWKDAAMTLSACGNLSFRSGHLLLTHTCRSQTLTVSALTRTSLLSLTVGLNAVQPSYCMPVICVLKCVCTHKGFLTSTSCVPGMSLYGQNDQFDTCFIASRLQNIPALSAPTGDTKQRDWELLLVSSREIFLLTAAPAHSDKLSTCFVRKSSLEAL